MRDHPNHRTSILGGMWGARLKLKYLNKPKLQTNIAPIIKILCQNAINTQLFLNLKVLVVISNKILFISKCLREV